MKETKYPHRMQLYEWKNGKVIPKPKTLQKIDDVKLREEMAIIAINHYLPFVKDKKKILKATNAK